MEKSFPGREILCTTCKCNHMAIYWPLSKTGFRKLACMSDLGCPLTFFQFLFVQWKIKRIWLGKRKLLDQDLLLVGSDTGLHFFLFFFNYENSLEKLILSPSEPYIFWSCEMNQVSLFWGQYLLQGRSSSQSFNASLFPLLLQWILRKISWSWDRSPDLFFLFHLCVFGKWLISTLHIGMVYIPTLSFAREVWCCRGRSVGSVVILTWNWTLTSPLN